jgi:hypothetical protein
MLGEVEFLDVWNEAYAAVMKHTRGVDGYWVDSSTLFSFARLTDPDADSQHVQGHILDHQH